MPEPLDREAFLRKVADAVDLQPGQVGEVLEELNGHLSDAVESLREIGVAPDDAESRAIRSLGDPVQLGRELGRARHQRRQLLAAAGGGIKAALTFGIWSFLFVWIAFGGLVMAATLVALAVLHGLRIETGSWLSGPAGSVITVSITTLWFAWMGWTLPQAVARSSRRSVRGVRRAVGVVGLVAGTVLLWLVPQLAMDQVLALGLPIAPFAFLIASERPAREQRRIPATTARLRLGVAIAVMAGTVVLGLLTMGPTGQASRGYGVNTAAIGASEFQGLPASDALPSAVYAETGGASPVLTAWMSAPDSPWLDAFVSRYPTVSLEVWPTALTAPDFYVPKRGPLVTAQLGTEQAAHGSPIMVAMPMPHSPQLVIEALVAHGADGSRVVIDAGIETTPPWHGTLFDWWFGAR